MLGIIRKIIPNVDDGGTDHFGELGQSEFDDKGGNTCDIFFQKLKPIFHRFHYVILDSGFSHD